MFPVVLEIDGRVAAADVVALVAAAAPSETFVVVKTPSGYAELPVSMGERGKADVVVDAKHTMQEIVTRLAKAKGSSIALR